MVVVEEGKEREEEEDEEEDDEEKELPPVGKFAKLLPTVRMRSPPRINPSARPAGPCSPRGWKRPRGRPEPPQALLPAGRRAGGAAGTQRRRGRGGQRLRAALGVLQDAPGLLMVPPPRSSCGAVPPSLCLALAFSSSFFLHEINARPPLLPPPPREPLSLRSQHRCTCQPLRSHSRSRRRSLALARRGSRSRVAGRRNVSPR